MTNLFKNISFEEQIPGQKGDKGDKGDRGERGLKGDKGDQGVPGKDGKDGINGINGLDGVDGKNGKDGSPDSAEQIVNKINSLETDPDLQIDASHIKNLPKLEQPKFIGGGIMNVAHDSTLSGNGTQASPLSVVGGGGSVTSVSNSDSTITISPTIGDVVASLNVGNANTWSAKQTFSSAALSAITSKLLKTDSSGNVVAATAGTDYQAPIVFQKGSAAYTVGLAQASAISVTFSPAFASTPTVIGTLVYSPQFNTAYQYYAPGFYIRTKSTTGFTFVVNMDYGGIPTFGTTGTFEWLAWL